MTAGGSKAAPARYISLFAVTTVEWTVTALEISAAHAGESPVADAICCRLCRAVTSASFT